MVRDQFKHSKKAYISIAVAVIIALLAIIFGGILIMLDNTGQLPLDTGAFADGYEGDETVEVQDSDYIDFCGTDIDYSLGQSTTDDDGYPDIDWDYWLGINPDILGWVTVPGTNIDYPIVQAHESDPTYYLHHDIYGNYSSRGCPYLDYRCEADGLDSYNATIFGHHLNSNTMFSAFSNFSNRNYAEQHRTIFLQTPVDKHILDVAWVNVVNADVYLNMLEFSNNSAYENWYANEVDQARVVLDSTVPQHDCMFVTCSYTTWKNERTIVVATRQGEDRADVWHNQQDIVIDSEVADNPIALDSEGRL